MTGCARGTWVVEISSLALKKAGTMDATWIGSDWINLPLWFTKQQNLGIGLQEVNWPSLIQVVSSSFIPPPHPPPPLYSCSPQSSCIPTVSVWCMWLFKLKTITFFTAITVWKCKSRTTSRGMIHYKISKAAAASAKTNNIFGLMMEPVFFWRFSALKIPGLP